MWWILGGLSVLYLMSRMGGGGGTVAPRDAGGGGGAIDDPSCKGVARILPPPIAGLGTGLDAIPTTPMADLGGKPYRVIYDEFLAIPRSKFGGGEISDAFIDFDIEVGTALAKELFCSGYPNASAQLEAKIKELRTWKST